MGVHSYCIVPAGQEPPAGLTGVEDAPVHSLEVDSLAVWMSAHETPPQPSAESAASHNAVVVAATTQVVTPVPVRFGQWLETEEETRARVAADAPRWQALLDRFAGCAEYAVTVDDPQVGQSERDVRAEPAESGTAYMAALAYRYARQETRKRRADVITSELSEAVGPLARDRSAEAHPDGVALVSLVFLVAWEHVDAYHSAVRRLAESRPELRFRQSGPWPPYSFAG